MNSCDQRRFTVLCVDDDPAMLSGLRRLFPNAAFEIVGAENGVAALEIAARKPVDAALIDIQTQEINSRELSKLILEIQPHIQLIMHLSSGGDVEAVQAGRSENGEFPLQSCGPESLRLRIQQLYRMWCLEQENRILKEQVQSQFGFDQLIGNTTAILNLKRMIFQVSASDANVLIQGESGTGKELVARAIHRHSARGDAAFVSVNCAGVSETVIGGELFGHVRGAFSGSGEITNGLIRSADQGTLFLDEVGELSMSMQFKILRIMLEKEVRPVGAGVSFPVNVRILAATTRDLEAEIAQGRFRQDLFYRLNVVEMKVPPLRDRREDIPILVRYFINRFRTPASPVRKMADQALACLQSYEWPGNVRELENMIRRAVAMGQQEEIAPTDLPEDLWGKSGCGLPQIDDDRLEAYEFTAIRNALAKCAGHRKRTARLLGIGEATLYRKLIKYQLS